MVKRDLRLTRCVVVASLAPFTVNPMYWSTAAQLQRVQERSSLFCVAALKGAAAPKNGLLYSSFYLQCNSEISLEQVTPCLMIRPSWLVVKIQIPPLLTLPALYYDPNLSLCTPAALTNGLYLRSCGHKYYNEGNGQDSRCCYHSNGFNFVKCHSTGGNSSKYVGEQLQSLQLDKGTGACVCNW